MTPEEFLARKTFYCSELGARITPEQCKANRTRPDKSGGNLSSAGRPTRPHPCSVCTDFEPRCASVGTVPNPKPKKPKEKKAMPKRGICLACARGPMSVTAKGLCSVCNKARNEGSLVQEGDEWTFLGATPGFLLSDPTSKLFQDSDDLIEVEEGNLEGHDEKLVCKSDSTAKEKPQYIPSEAEFAMSLPVIGKNGPDPTEPPMLRIGEKSPKKFRVNKSGRDLLGLPERRWVEFRGKPGSGLFMVTVGTQDTPSLFTVTSKNDICASSVVTMFGLGPGEYPLVEVSPGIIKVELDQGEKAAA